MNTTLLKHIRQIRQAFRFPVHKDKNIRRQWLAGALQAFLLVLSLLALINAIFYFWPFDDPDHVSYALFIAAIAGLLALLWAANRNPRLSRFTRLLTILFLMVGILFSDAPESVIWGSTFILFALPIISSSFILSPTASFLVALVVNLEVQVFASLTFPGREIYPIYDGLSLLTIAGVAWLAAASLESALADLERERVFKKLLLTSFREDLAAPLADILQISATGGPPNLDLARIHRRGRLLQAQMNFLLDLDDLEMRTLTLEQTPVDLVPLLRSVADLLNEPFAQKKQSLLLDSVPENAGVMADRRRAEQVLINLLGAVSRLSPEGAEISVVLRDHENGLWQLSVNSSGLDLSPERAQRLFQPGESFAALRQMVETQSGKLWCAASSDRSAQFILQLNSTMELSRARL